MINDGEVLMDVDIVVADMFTPSSPMHGRVGYGRDGECGEDVCTKLLLRKLLSNQQKLMEDHRAMHAILQKLEAANDDAKREKQLQTLGKSVAKILMHEDTIRSLKEEVKRAVTPHEIQGMDTRFDTESDYRDAVSVTLSTVKIRRTVSKYMRELMLRLGTVEAWDGFNMAGGGTKGRSAFNELHGLKRVLYGQVLETFKCYFARNSEKQPTDVMDAAVSRMLKQCGDDVVKSNKKAKTSPSAPGLFG